MDKVKPDRLAWFTLDWGKRWGLPIVLSAIAIGALAGATEYRFNVPVVTTQGSTTTVTETQVSLEPAPEPETRVETRVVKETVRLTGEAPPPQVREVVREVPAAPQTATVTVTRTVTAEPETVTAQPDVPAMQVGNRGNGNGPG